MVILLYILLLSVVLFFIDFLIILTKKFSLKKNGFSFQEKYIFLFPVLEEQNIVLNKLKYLQEILNEDIDVKFIFIVSPNEKERLLLKNITNKTTEEILKIELKKFPFVARRSIIIKEENNPRETKASKINYAIQYLKKSYHIQDYIIGIFDFDGMINIQDYRSIDEYIFNNKDTSVFSTIPFPIFKNSNLIGYSSGFFQLERIFFKEYLGKIEYCMGAGLFIRGNYFLDNLLPSFNDDIALGYKLFFQNINKKIINIFTYVTLPKKSIGNIKQLIPVYMAVFSYFNIMKQQEKISYKNYLYGFFVIFRDLFDITETVLLLILIPLYPQLVIFVITFYIIKSFIIYYLYRKISSIKLNTVIIPIYYIFGKFLKLFSFLYFILHNMQNKDIYSIKTER